MSKSYKEIRRDYKIQIENGECICVLSGLKIEDERDLSLEHFVPKSRASYILSTKEENIFPAFKIINSIKDWRLPCEWENNKTELLNKALQKNQLNSHQREIVEKAINNIPNYKLNTCSFCVLYETCYNGVKTR